MKYISHEDGVRARSFRSIVYSWIFFLVVTVFGCVIFMTESNAFIFERFDIMNGQSMANPDSKTNASLPLFRNDDNCDAFLQDASYGAVPANAINKAPDLPSSDVTARRKAGQAIALALMAGMTIAVEPAGHGLLNENGENVSKLTPKHRNAFQVVAYRQCKRQSALRELETSRWSR